MDWIGQICGWFSGYVAGITTGLAASGYTAYIGTVLLAVFTCAVAVFTGLYWRNAKKAFLLELDRFVLWSMLEERKGEDAKTIVKRMAQSSSFDWTPDQRRDLQEWLEGHFEEGRYAGKMAFYDTLASKTLKKRLESYERKKGKVRKLLRGTRIEAEREEQATNKPRNKNLDGDNSAP